MARPTPPRRRPTGGAAPADPFKLRPMSKRLRRALQIALSLGAVLGLSALLLALTGPAIPLALLLGGIGGLLAVGVLVTVAVYRAQRQPAPPPPGPPPMRSSHPIDRHARPLNPSRPIRPTIPSAPRRHQRTPRGTPPRH